MEASEFVKKFGLDVAKDLAYRDKTSVGYLSVEHHDVYQDDLKRLVKSHELVMDYYGLARAKEHAESKYTAPELKVALKQAIADVEACMDVVE